MLESSMRRYVPVLVGGAALIAAACSEPSAPAPSNVVAELPTLSRFVSAERFNASAYQEAGTFYFTLSPAGGKAKIGAYTLRYDANAVCNPSTSSYGPSEWYNSCATLSSPITIVARFWVEDGRTYADFSPDIRFEPSKNVTISTRVPGLRGQSLTDAVRNSYSVGYTKVADGMRYFIDEAASDASLATVFEEKNGQASGWISRRVLHFSGYYVRSGRACDETSAECGDGTLDQSY